MNAAKKSGKAVLKSDSNGKTAGICTYSIDGKGIEIAISTQSPQAGSLPEAVLQYGPDRNYLCRPPVSFTNTIRCADTAVMAVWVLDNGKPVLFGQLRAGAFDQKEARKNLPGSTSHKHDAAAQAVVAAAALPSSVAPANPMVKPANREAATREPAVSFLSASQDARTEPPPKSAEPEQKATNPPAGASTLPRQETDTLQTMRAANPQHAKDAAPVLQPLVIKRAPRPTHRPVYSPLWDDVSAEFEKLLESLPKAHPFNGSIENAEFAELPTDGAVQCYIGSVMIDGMKVFLQAVPARPYSRPAGFDHSLVSRSGESYWVKYFVQNA